MDGIRHDFAAARTSYFVDGIRHGKVTISQRQEYVIWLGLYFLILLAIANVWVTRATADSATPNYSTSATSPQKTVLVVTLQPDLRTSVLSAASPF